MVVAVLLIFAAAYLWMVGLFAADGSAWQAVVWALGACIFSAGAAVRAFRR